MTTDSKHKSADQALEYLCWVVNAEVLFDFAMKTYDFELVIMVAKHTQKDPKEYLPYLKKLQEMDPVFMRYQINFDLKDYDNALLELSKGEDKYFEKCLELITKYELYELALTLFHSNEPLFASVYEHYGNYLKGKKQYYEAGYAYLRSKKEENALKCFVDSGALNEVTSLIRKLKITDEKKLEELFIEFMDVCSAAKKPAEVEKLYAYLKERQVFLDSDTLQIKMMDSLLRGKKWKVAYLFYLETNFPIVHEEFNNGIQLASNLRMNEFKKNKDFFDEKYNRLLKVQNLKRTSPHLFIFDNKMLEDNVSETGSVISSQSGRSMKSKKSSASRTSKKSKAKMAKRTVKEGSPLEEEYLIMILLELKMSKEDIENLRELITVLNYLKLSQDYGKVLDKQLEVYLKNVNPIISDELFSVAQQDFINKSPEMKELFPQLFKAKKNANGELITKD